MNPARGREIYDQGHLPGAFFAGVDFDLSGSKTGTNGRHPLPDPDRFATFLANCGVDAGSRLVAYDDVGGQYAARFWWLCRWIGHEGAAVLDGGWSKWTSEGRPVSTRPPDAVAGSISIRARPDLVATTGVVEEIVEGGPGLIVDARAPERYRGEVEPLDKVAGHIPGAINWPFQKSLNADKTFRSPPELAELWREALADFSADQVIHQCGSGITACVNILSMEQAGLAGSRLYPGSWSEWSADPSRPVVTRGQ